MKAQRIQDKVAGVGFDWEQPEQVWEKVQEELAEFKAEVIRAIRMQWKLNLETCFFH